MSVTLITGGVRSGKSLHAEKLTSAAGAHPHYIFTAEVYDVEMAERVALHQARRGRDWREHHAPLNLVEVLSACEDGAPRLVDCIPLWLTNLMMLDADIPDNVQKLTDYLSICSLPTFLVTAEVGLGIHPENALARRFADALGSLNQNLASIAARMDLIIAGQVLRVK